MPKVFALFSLTLLAAALCLASARGLDSVLDRVLGAECCCGARFEARCCAGG